MTQYHQKKIAMINDLSGYGRCSITAALPVLAALKIQCCPVPTSVLSNHTGFPVYFFDDYTDKMEPYVEKWKELGLSFDGIVSGFLGSERQIQIVKNMITEFKGPETKGDRRPDHGRSRGSLCYLYRSHVPENEGTGRNGRCFNAKSYRRPVF